MDEKRAVVRTIAQVQAELDAAMARLRANQAHLSTVYAALYKNRLSPDAPELKDANRESNAIRRDVRRLLEELKVAQRKSAI
jgi:hypothetical protein